MKSTGIARRVDELGRISIPIELRRAMDIKTNKEKGSLNKKDGDAVEIFTDGERIVLKKYQPGCHCCGSIDNLTEVLGLKICPSCLDEFYKYKKMIDKVRGEK